MRLTQPYPQTYGPNRETRAGLGMGLHKPLQADMEKGQGYALRADTENFLSVGVVPRHAL